MKSAFRRVAAAGMALGMAMLLSVQAGAASYTVSPGDTLWRIAAAHQTGVSKILGANPRLTNPDRIYPGQVLQIPAGDETGSAYEAEVVRLVNEARRRNGLTELQEDWELSRVARYKSQDMRDRGYFGHNSPTYGTPFEMIRAFGLRYRTAGENIAVGYPSPEAVVNGWMRSDGHRANILKADFTRIGVGYEPRGRYWTQMFIG